MFDFKVTLLKGDDEILQCGGPSATSCGTDMFEITYEQLDIAYSGYGYTFKIEVRVYSVSSDNTESYNELSVLDY